MSLTFGISCSKISFAIQDALTGGQTVRRQENIEKNMKNIKQIPSKSRCLESLPPWGCRWRFLNHRPHDFRTLTGYQFRTLKVSLYELCCGIHRFQPTRRKGHGFGVQKKEPSRDKVFAQRCKTFVIGNHSRTQIWVFNLKDKAVCLILRV